jgi:hypothetical protein
MDEVGGAIGSEKVEGVEVRLEFLIDFVLEWVRLWEFSAPRG